MRKAKEFLCYCPECDFEFDTPDEKEVDAEDYYGVGDLFPDHHSMVVECCPNCGNEDFNDWR